MKTFVAAGLALFLHLAARAHPISLTTCEVLVSTNEVTSRVKVMCEDFVMLYGYMANRDSMISRADLEEGTKRHSAMLLRDYMVRDRAGNALPGELVRIEADPIPDAGLPIDELMNTKVVYHLRHPLAVPPQYLTFQQKLGMSEGAFLPSLMQFALRQVGHPPMREVTLSGAENVETYEFDWESPPGSAAARPSPAEKKEPRSMGIESYSAVYSFIYVEDAEVRVEILMPLLTLETWQSVERKNPDFLEVAEQAAARPALNEFFTSHNKVMIDGIEVTPVVQRLDFYGVDFKDFATRAEPDRLSSWTARVGVILGYSTKGRPAQVDVTWDLFNAQVVSTRAAIFAGPESRRHLFTRFKPACTWKNPDPAVAAEIPPVRLPSPDDAARAVIAETLLKNVYRAFDHRKEDVIYDALARSVAGDLLADTYLKVHAGLLMAEQGGAVSRVDEVKPVGVRIENSSSNGFTAHMAWRVTGTVEHWGHLHTRVNAYEAAFTIRREAGAWQITAMDAGRQERISYQVKVRKF